MWPGASIAFRPPPAFDPHQERRLKPTAPELDDEIPFTHAHLELELVSVLPS